FFTGTLANTDVPQTTIDASNLLVMPTGSTTTQGGGGQNEVQVLTYSATGGSFSLSFNGQTTAPIAFNATTATVQTALQGLTTVGAGNVTVAGAGFAGNIGSFTLTFVGALANTNVSQVNINTAAVSANTFQDGGGGLNEVQQITETA